MLKVVIESENYWVQIRSEVEEPGCEVKRAAADGSSDCRALCVNGDNGDGLSCGRNIAGK